MKLRFDSQPFAGKDPRPTPEVLLDPSVNTLIVAVPWGSREVARKVIDRMLEYLSFASQDREATSPLPRMSCLSTAANNLRTAAMLANDMIYREENSEQYKAGVELFAATLAHNELSWVQVGGPHLLLGRGKETLLPLGSSVDLALDLDSGSGAKGSKLSALPALLLGLDTNVNLTINSLRARPGDSLVLLAHSRAPNEFYGLRNENLTKDHVVRTLTKNDGDTAFWLGLLSIEAEASDLSSATESESATSTDGAA